MGNPEFAWELLLQTDAPPGCALKAALFATYDRADERLLAEHLLPVLLKLNREPDGEGAERQFYLLELDRRLKQLHGQLVVVSSTERDEATEQDQGDAGGYGWIWRSIRQLTVGRRGRAVQHAKLWLLHWGASEGEGAEYLEIVVSSCNLTMSAFRGQLQAAWRACVELRPQRAEARLRKWGVLPDFLRELGASASDASCLEPFVDLLARAMCPDGVSFVASVPGTHSRQVLRRTPWGVAGLRRVTPPGRGRVTASILSPYIGSWNDHELRQWCATFEGSPDRIELVWIDEHHPWARAKRWLLPKATLAVLTDSDATLLHLRHTADDPDQTDLFHEDHRAADDRWGHAKVYALRRGTSRSVLVTSANLSTSAWGSRNSDGDLTIENFELGVRIEKGGWPFKGLGAFGDNRDAATVSDAPGRIATRISWAQAVWDGTSVVVECRCEAECDLKGEIKTGNDWTAIPAWKVAADGWLRSATVPCADPKQPPSIARLSCEQETVTVAVFDARPVRDREETVPSEVDENAAQTMRDQLLFEQYGAPVAPEDDNEATTIHPRATNDQAGAELEQFLGGDDDLDEGEVGSPDSYAVPAFVHSRRHLGVVDNWADRVKRLAGRGTAQMELRWLRRDGELLVEAFWRQAARDEGKGPGRALGANLAAEELSLRLRHVPEA